MRAVLAVLGILVVLAGCSSSGGSSDDVVSAVAPAKSADDPIPPVRNPKNLAAIQPCLLLTPAQLETNRIDQPGQPKNVVGNTGCDWTDKARTRQFVAFVDIGNDVLHNVYGQRETIPVFEMTDVAGLPAIRTKDDLNGSSCYFRVATAQWQTLIVRFTSLGQGRVDPCPPARQFAETVVGNLPPAIS